MTRSLQNFLDLCAIPRPSGGEGAVVDHLFRALTALGYAPERDGANNLRCLIPAAAGCESVPCVALQAHTDMVCVAAPGSGYRPGLDPVRTVERDGWLCSDGRSTLGADNGAAAAIMQSIAQCPPPKHGPILLLFTATEEQGMVGVKALSASWLNNVQYLINLDSFQESPAICGSAGGLRQSWTRPVKTEQVTGAQCVQLTLSGLTGGHSGYDIHRGRGSAVSMLAAFLQSQPCRIHSLNGGSGYNAIPTRAEAVVCVEDMQTFSTAVGEWEQKLRQACRETDPALAVSLSDIQGIDTIWSTSTQHDVLNLLTALPCGVLRRFDDGTTADSANLAVVETGKTAVTVRHFARSATRAVQAQMERDTAALAAANRFIRTEYSAYAPWESAPDSPLLRLVQRCCLARRGVELAAQRVHVGLECALLVEKASQMQAVSLGCNIRDAHAVTERVELRSMERLEELLRDILLTLTEEDNK